MNRKFKLILVLFALSATASLGKYFPLVVEGAVWGEKGGSIFNTSIYQYRLSGDTVLNGEAYKILNSLNLYNSNSNCYPWDNTQECNAPIVLKWNGVTAVVGFLREDTLAKIVYFKKTKEDIERVLYDFNFEVGDTMSFSGVKSSVSSIDSILIGMENRKRVVFPSTGALLREVSFFEGIGSDCGLFVDCYVFEGGTALLCYKLDGKVLYGDTNSCQDFVYTSVQHSPLKSSLKVFQKESSLVIDMGSNNPSKGTLSIRFINGTVLYQKENLTGNQWTLNLKEHPTLKKGVVLVEVVKGREHLSKKIVLY